jgi:hypothetical protein
MDNEIKKKDEEIPKTKVYGDPAYDAADDIYSKSKKVESVDADDNPKLEKIKSKKKQGDSDLDIPGSELDDADEAIGEEDEENNFYSLGGDDHNDLEEDQGE